MAAGYHVTLLCQASNVRGVAAEVPAPLDPNEELAWRALARALIVVPRALESELLAEHICADTQR